MKTLPVAFLAAVIATGLVCPRRGFAAPPPPSPPTVTLPPPTVVPPDSDLQNLLQGLKGAPDNVKTLIQNFNQVADQRLQQQQALLLMLKNATTAAEREAIRQQLQDNRQAFLASLRDFRQDLRADLQALKGKITHAEVLRILDAANDAAGPTGPRHKGKN